MAVTTETAKIAEGTIAHGRINFTTRLQLKLVASSSADR